MNHKRRRNDQFSEYQPPESLAKYCRGDREGKVPRIIANDETSIFTSRYSYPIADKNMNTEYIDPIVEDNPSVKHERFS